MANDTTTPGGDSVGAHAGLIQEAEGLLAKATPGPWATFHYDGKWSVTTEPRNDVQCEDITGPLHNSEVPNAANDVAFIARSRTLVPELNAALREADAEIRRLRAHAERGWREAENTDADWDLMLDRAETAERQRDEAVGLVADLGYSGDKLALPLKDGTPQSVYGWLNRRDALLAQIKRKAGP